MKKKFSFSRSLLGGIIGGFLTLLLAFVVFNGVTNEPTPVNSQAAMIQFEEVITGIVEDNQNSVVSVGNYRVNQGGNIVWGPSGLEIADIEQEPQLAGTGSGVIYKKDGDYAYVVTNNHVISGHDRLEVTLANGTALEAEEIGSDVLSDLAVLRIAGDQVESTIEFANSDEVKVGQLAIAIGSPIGLNFSSSVTQGIVSGLDRAIPVDTNNDGASDWEMVLMQTDAAINPGNSGGALVNSQGQLIGINSSKFAASAIEGMGFAIPSNDVQSIIQQLEENGQVIRPFLGVGTVNLNRFSLETRVNDFGLAEDMTQGAIVAEVKPNSSAEKAGIEVYDIITAINGETVEDGQTLKKLLYQYQVGETIEITLIRQGEEMTVSVVLEAGPDNSME